jgi:hypothetical protein
MVVLLIFGKLSTDVRLRNGYNQPFLNGFIKPLCLLYEAIMYMGLPCNPYI